MHTLFTSLTLLLASIVGLFTPVSLTAPTNTIPPVIIAKSNIEIIPIAPVFSREKMQSTNHVSVYVAQTPPEVNFKLTIGDKTYTTHIRDGETLYEVMLSLSSSAQLAFTGREYIGMGFFVESINGKPNAYDHYWILYKNNALSSTGISQTTLHAGDSVEWKYEKSY